MRRKTQKRRSVNLWIANYQPKRPRTSDTPNDTNGGGNNGDDNINGNGNANANGREVPPRTEPHVMDGEPRSMSEFGPYDEDILDESLGTPCHDEARERLLRSATKVARDNNQLLGRIQAIEDHRNQVLQYEENLKGESKRKEAKKESRKHGRNRIEDLDVMDHSAVSKCTWAKDLHPGLGARLPSRDSQWADTGKHAPKASRNAGSSDSQHQEKSSYFTN